MSNFYPANESEPRPITEVAPPALELFLNPEAAFKTWPDQAENLDFWLSVEGHATTAKQITGFMDKLGDEGISPQEALSQGLVDQEEVLLFYANLTNVLMNPESRRLMLYLPFEYLPRADWEPENEQLAGTVEGFRDMYTFAWSNLLSVYDPKANFIDGDVLEPELRRRDVDRVIKAAHLTPRLIEAGLISVTDILEHAEASTDLLLKINLAEGLEALPDDYQLTDQECYRLVKLTDLVHDYKALNELSPETGTTPRREEWLKQTKINALVEATAAHMGQEILAGTSSAEDVIAYANTNGISREICVETILHAVTQAAETKQADPAGIYAEYKDFLHDLWLQNEENVRARLTKAYRHLRQLDVLNDDQLDQIGITMPALAGPMSENLRYIPEVENLRLVTERLATDPEFFSFVYPVVTVGGSRLKGYGDPSSDLDLGIFVRLNVPEDEKQELRQRVAAVFEEAGITEVPLEFWLTETDSGLAIRELDNYDPYVADKYWTHMLFNTAWVGDTDAIEMLRKELLAAYFDKPADDTDRRMYLEKLEQDLLQYRLMHKGYKRHYPAQIDLNERQSELIDGASPFWDPGFRRLATRLFVNNVFLPKTS